MAYPVPPTPAAGAIPLPTPITTYLHKYQEQGDALEGRYQEFLAPYAPDSGRTHAQLMARILATMAEVPKVFLGLVEHAGVTLSITLHRPTQYTSHPVDTSVWDGATLALAGDVLAGNHIEIVWVPAIAFEVAPDNNVPTIAGSHQPTCTSPGPSPQSTGALGASWGSHHQRQMRNGVRRVVKLVTLRAHTTKGSQQHTHDITTGILSWSHQSGPPNALHQHTAPKPQVECTTPGPTSAGPITIGPNQPSGAPRPGAQGRTGSHPSSGGGSTKPHECSQDAFPQMAAHWRTYCLATGDDGLPPIYTIWANTTKAERRVALQSALEECVNTGLAAGRIIPLASKELYEIVLQGCFAVSYHEVDDLTKGLQPFTCSFQSMEWDRDIASRASQFNQMMAGLVTPSLAEQETFWTKEVPLPSTVYQLGM